MGLKKVQAKIRQSKDTYNVYLYATKNNLVEVESNK
jgi:hypothetical protein